jgi:uncharacterized protein
VTQFYPEQPYIHSRVLKINVGFFLGESPGFSREFNLDIPQPLKVAEDVTVETLKGIVRLTRTSEGILVQGDLDSSTKEICSRCLTETIVTVPLELEELFNTAPHQGSNFIVTEDNILDLAPLVREEVLISMPYQVYCRPDCAGLCPTCGKNLNHGPCDCEPDVIDPRWAALSDLHQKLSEDDDEI